MSAIRVELEKALKTKQGKKEDYDEYLERLIDDAAEDLSDDEFDGLSTETQKWLNRGTAALDKKKPAQDFPDHEEGEEEEEKPKKGKAKGKAKGKGKAKPEVEEEEEEEEEEEPKKGKAKGKAKEKPKVEEEEVEEEETPKKGKAKGKAKASTKKAPAKKEAAEVSPSRVYAEKVRVLIAQKPNKSCKEIVEICETKGIDLNSKSISNEYSRMHKVLRTLTSKGLIELKGYKG